MEKYKNFIEIIGQLEAAVDKMATVGVREEVEALELETKGYFNALMVKFPYIQSDIHDYAAEQISRISQSDTAASLGE